MKFSNRKQPEKRRYQPIANNSGWGNVKGGYQPEKGQDKPRPVPPKVSSGEDAWNSKVSFNNITFFKNTFKG